MGKKLNQLGSFLLAVLLFGLHITVDVLYVLLEKTGDLVYKLDVLINEKIQEEKSPTLIEKVEPTITQVPPTV